MAKGSEERPAPSAIGTLATRPLVHLLVYARNRRLTGSLEVHAPDGRDGTLGLWRGRIHEARTAPPVAYFGAVAYELGLVETATIDATLLEISKSRRLHGEVLIERGALTREQRDAVLVEQTCRKVHHLFSLPPDSTFSFYDAKASVEPPPFTLDPIMPAWRGLRADPPAESVREVLERFSVSQLRLSNEGPIQHAGLDAEESALCEALTWKAMTLGQIRASTTMPAARVDLLVYLLVITKCVEPTSASQPGMPAVTVKETGEPRRGSMSFKVPTAPAFRSAAGGSSSRMPVAAAPVFSPADLGAVGIAHRASVIDSETPHETLGLPEGASLEAARAAYFRLAKLWHPDRLPEDLAPFRSEVASIFNRMTVAHRTLTDGAGPSSPAAEAKKERPRTEVIREIEQALAKREFEAAEAASRNLVSADSDDAEAQALVAWAMASAGEATEELLQKAMPLLDHAVHAQADCERAFYYRGVLHKRLGSSVAAYRDFSRVMQLNPKHVDAERELRIFEMRARKGSGEHALDALIAKTKKK